MPGGIFEIPEVKMRLTLQRIKNQMKNSTFFVAENPVISENTVAHKTMGRVQWKARGPMLAQSVLTRALIKKQSK